jgi:broad specificity phosphatase PhoE
VREFRNRHSVRYLLIFSLNVITIVILLNDLVIQVIKTFYIARHGETVWNTQKRLQGQLDSPLTPAGLLQAQGLAKIIAKTKIDAIYSSPLPRALTTANICGEFHGLNVIQDRLLMERDFGAWQGRYFESLRQELYFDEIFSQVTSHAPPNGEPGTECKQRMHNALISIADTNARNILIVSHGDLIRCFLSELTSQVGCDAYSQYGNGSVFKICFDQISQAFELASRSD